MRCWRKDTKWLLAKWTLHHCTTIDATVPNETWFRSRKVNFFFLCLQHNVVDEVLYGIYKKHGHVAATLPVCIGDLKQDLETSLFLCTISFYYTLSNDFTNFLYNRPRLRLSLRGFDCHLISFQRLCLFASLNPVQEQYMR